MKQLNYIDLFAGAGGLSEGFIHEKFDPIAHVEMSAEAADTLKTRIAFHHLSQKKNLTKYYYYLQKNISRNELWNTIPQHLLDGCIIGG